MVVDMEITLPDQPPLLARVISTLSDPCADVHSMAHSLSPTPELSHGFVRLANTFGRRGRVSCATEAILELGPRASRQLILCLATKKHLSAISSHGFGLDAFWLSSLRRAFACHAIANTLGITNDLTLFGVGFHQDIGVLLRAQEDPISAQALNELANAPALRRLRAERRRGLPHDEVGLAFCRRWALPAEVAVPIRYHHQPEQAPRPFATASLIACAAESIADLATNADISPVLALAEQSMVALRIHGLLPKLFDQVADFVDDTAEAFGLDAMPEARFLEVRNRGQERESGLRMSKTVSELELLSMRRENEALRQQLARVSEELASMRSSNPPSGVQQLDVDPSCKSSQHRQG